MASPTCPITLPCLPAYLLTCLPAYLLTGRRCSCRAHVGDRCNGAPSSGPLPFGLPGRSGSWEPTSRSVCETHDNQSFLFFLVFLFSINCRTSCTPALTFFVKSSSTSCKIQGQTARSQLSFCCFLRTNWFARNGIFQPGSHEECIISSVQLFWW